MAITVQLAAADTLAGGGHSATSSSRNVTLGAGSNRALVVASALEAASANASVVTSVTYGGVALSKVTDGDLIADLNTLAGSDDIANLIWWILLEDDLPANGSNALVANVSAGRQHGLSWYILEGVDQENPVIDVAMAFNGNAQSITATLSDADPDGLCLFAAYKNNTGVSNAVNTIDGSAGTALSDDQNQGGAHVRFVRGVGSGSSACTFSHSSGNARIGIVAIALRAAVTSKNVEIEQATFVAGSATMSASAARGRVVESASFVAQAASFSAQATVTDVVVESAAFVAGSATMSASAARGRVASSAAFTAGSASFSAQAARGRSVSSAAFAAQSASFSASASRFRNIPGTLDCIEHPARIRCRERAATLSCAELPARITGKDAAI